MSAVTDLQAHFRYFWSDPGLRIDTGHPRDPKRARMVFSTGVFGPSYDSVQAMAQKLRRDLVAGRGDCAPGERAEMVSRLDAWLGCYPGAAR